MNGFRRGRELPQLLIGLLAVAIALAVAVPLTASIVMNGIRDVKTKRDTIVVTGSAKYPITANQAFWNVTVTSTERQPAAAARSLNSSHPELVGANEWVALRPNDWGCFTWWPRSPFWRKPSLGRFTSNLSDFMRVPDLSVEDWSV